MTFIKEFKQLQFEDLIQIEKFMNILEEIQIVSFQRYEKVDWYYEYDRSFEIWIRYPDKDT